MALIFMNLAVEGLLDQHVARKVVRYVGAEVNHVHVQQGKHDLLQKLPNYNHAARQGR
ncbi:MAG: hypothetical protein RMI91_03395 [Gemmatales bacterium]|nr:hypothetical protein [Gemmatales bacterium]MDW7993676.1 hypothetical protein [Gemmatales bacterium]